jgi:regulator of protease activity HflC (stomatin/prohibitin superfamily)
MTDSEAAEVEQQDKKPRRHRHRLSTFDRLIGAALAAGFVALLLWPLMVFVVGPGDVGVLFRTLTTGTDTEHVIPEGVGVKWPWNRVYEYEVRTQNLSTEVHALSLDGLRILLDIAVLYHPDTKNVGYLHKEIGPDYAERFAKPRAIEAVRTTVGNYDPHDLYQMDLGTIEDAILGELQSKQQQLIVYEAVVVKNISLPDSLNTAITNKLTQEQNALAYSYVLQRERKEAERKRIEAIGYQTFYSIVADALTLQLLTWKGIDATVQLSRSNNSKIVIVGSGKDQLPLILGSDIAKQPDLPAPSAVNPSEFELPDLNTLPPMFDNSNGQSTTSPPSSGAQSSMMGTSAAGGLTQTSGTSGDASTSATSKGDNSGTGTGGSPSTSGGQQ